MEKTELLICGFGGQGVIFAGQLVGRTAVVAGMEVAQSASYGSEARGSACHAGVVVSSELISYPKVRKPDILIALSQAGYDKFISTVKPKGKVIYDCDLVKSENRDGIDQIGLPSTAIATQMGRKGVGNVILLAAVTALTNFVPKEALQQALDEQSPPAFKEMNRKAIIAGFKLAEEIL